MRKISIVVVSLGIFFFGFVVALQKVVAATGKADMAKLDYGKYITKEIIGISPFSAIDASGIADIYYSQAAQTSVSVYAQEDIIRDHLEIYNADKTLVIKNKGNMRSSTGSIKIKVYVTGPELTDAKTSGTGDIIVADKLETKSLKLTTLGTGDIKLGHVECRMLDAKTSGTGDIEIQRLIASEVSASSLGTGDIELKGRAAIATYNASGTGDIDADELIAENVTAKASGTGDIECHASKKLDARASGTGRIEYKGNPSAVEKSGRERAVRPSR